MGPKAEVTTGGRLRSAFLGRAANTLPGVLRPLDIAFDSEPGPALAPASPIGEGERLDRHHRRLPLGGDGSLRARRSRDR